MTASLLGSSHCVGMCGPLAIWAGGAAEERRGSHIALASSLYHLGRLVTYTLAGLIAGALGQLADIGGQMLGTQLVAARLVGAAMIVIGLVQLGRLTIRFRQPTASSRAIGGREPRPALTTRILIRLRPYIFRLPLPMRGLLTGLLTTLLPCGWLYLFALIAAGTGSMLLGPVVMAAFWLGTVPALVALVAGTQLMAAKFRYLIPGIAALMLIIGGGFTASGRGFASLQSFDEFVSQVAQRKMQVGSNPSLHVETQAALPPSVDDVAIQSIVDRIDALVATPLPCCIEARHAAESETVSPPEPHWREPLNTPTAPQTEPLEEQDGVQPDVSLKPWEPFESIGVSPSDVSVRGQAQIGER